MAILLDEHTTVLIQGITGREGRARVGYMRAYGTRIVAGVTPGRGGSDVDGVPVYDTVQAAVARHGPIDATVTFVPGNAVHDAVLEAIDAGIRTVFMPVERVPLHDALAMLAVARDAGVRVIGPGSIGVLSAGRAAAGVPSGAVVGWVGGSVAFAREVFPPGHVGIISRSGGQTTTLAWALARQGLGITTAVHVGAEPVVGTSMAETLALFQADPETHAVAIFGEIGTSAEEEAADMIAAGGFTKPVVAYVAGAGAQAGMRFSHASAIVAGGGRGSAQGKIAALRAACATVVDRPEDLAPSVARALEGMRR